MAPRRLDSYDAFISYSRAADTAIAQALQQGVQRFGKPWYHARMVRVFRDESSLSANPGLWPSVQAALDASAYFVLLASPQAAASNWVEREIVHWLTRHPPAQLLIVLTAGEIVWDGAAGDFAPAATTALPPPLFGRFPDEPRWVDARWARGSADLSLAHLRFRETVADLAAPVRGLAKDELIGDAVTQHRRTVRLVQAPVAILASLALLAGTAGIIAVQQRDQARQAT